MSMEKDKLLILGVIIVVAITSFCTGFIISHYNERDKAMFYQDKYVECQESFTSFKIEGTEFSDYSNIYIDSYDNQEEKKKEHQKGAPDYFLS